MSTNWKDRIRYFRCHSVVDGRCTCGKLDCSSAGKHPKSTGWQQEAIRSTPEQAQAWNADPNINLGIACGADSDLFVLDVDIKKEDGHETLTKIQRQHEPLPTTLTVVTGRYGNRRGNQFYFKHQTTHEIKNAVSFLPGLDLRTTGGYVIASGARHASGVTYEVTIDHEPAPAPTWLLDLIVEGQRNRDKGSKKSKPPMLSSLPAEIHEGHRDQTLFLHGCFLRGQRGKSYEEILEALSLANQERCKPPLPDGDVRKLAGQAAQYEANVAIDDSDQALVTGFALAKREELRFLTDDSSWWGYDNGLWVERRSSPIYDCGEFLKAQEPPNTNKVLHRRLHSQKAVMSVLALAKDRPEFRAEARQFDPNPWLLGLPGGLALDLSTGEVRGACPNDLLTRRLPVTPSDEPLEKSCPRWLRYLEEAHPGDRDLQTYLQRHAGYCYTSSTREEMILFLIGEPGAGKGTYTETLEAYLGTYYTTLPLDLLLEEAKEDRRLNHVAKLFGARLGVCNEGARSKKLDRNAIKNLTGGGSVVARRLGHQAFEFPMTTKLIIVSNDEPVLDLDEAMKDRVHVVPFKQKFRNVAGKDDKGLKEYLRSNELPGIARWAVEGCLEWQRAGLRPPASVVTRTEQYFTSADTIERWAQECCDFDPRSFETTQDLFQSAKKFCEDIGEKGTVTHERLFIPELERRHKELRRDRPRGNGRSGKSGLWGIKLREHARLIITRGGGEQTPF